MMTRFKYVKAGEQPIYVSASTAAEADEEFEEQWYSLSGWSRSSHEDEYVTDPIERVAMALANSVSCWNAMEPEVQENYRLDAREIIPRYPNLLHLWEWPAWQEEIDKAHEKEEVG